MVCDNRYNIVGEIGIYFTISLRILALSYTASPLFFFKKYIPCTVNLSLKKFCHRERGWEERNGWEEGKHDKIKK